MTSLPNQSLFLSEAFSDVTFIVENQSIPAHKILLAANCSYFKAMLFGATNESKMSVIPLNNVSHKVFVEVIRCVYLRQIDICEWTPEEVKQLILIADEYQFPDLCYVCAEKLDIDTQMIIDIIDDAVGVSKRLNCNRLMEKCVQGARKWTELLFSNREAFDKLPMDLIVHLIDRKVWNYADARLVYSIGNWRKTTASTKDKKVLLSKIDWKSLPGKYSEPLVRMFLEDDTDGFQVKDWTVGLKKSNDIIDQIACIYLSDNGQFYTCQSTFPSLLQQCHIDLFHERRKACVIVFFREIVTNVTKVKFLYDGKATIDLKLHGDGEERRISGTRTVNNSEVKLPLGARFSSAALRIDDPNLNYSNKYSSHSIYDITFCID